MDFVNMTEESTNWLLDFFVILAFYLEKQGLVYLSILAESTEDSEISRRTDWMFQ